MSNNTNTPPLVRQRPSTMSRKQIAIRFFSYGVMTLATILGVIVCIAWAMGYRFDFISGQVSQVALLQFNSFPNGASVDIDDIRLSSRTATRHNVKAGESKISMSLAGYHSWSKTVTAKAGSVRWLDYVRLIPLNVKTDSVRAFTGVSDMMASPDRKWAALLLDQTENSFSLLDIQNPEKPDWVDFKLDESKLAKLDNAEAGSAKQEFRLVEWNSDSRYILIEHSIGDTTEYLIYDRVDEQTRNMSRDFGMSITKPHFSGTGGNFAFVLTGTDLRKIDYGNKSISAPIAQNVIDYTIYSNSRIAFISKYNENDKITQTVSIYDDGKITEVKQYDKEPIKVAFSRTNDTDYLSIARGETVAIIPDPLHLSSQPDNRLNTEIAYLSSPGGVDWLMMSDNGRFVMAGHNGKVVCYDIEENENFSFELKTNNKPQWLDNYHLLDIDNDNVTVVEFDGRNRQSIVSGHLPAFLSNNGRYLFSLDNISGGVVVQRSDLVVKN